MSTYFEHLRVSSIPWVQEMCYFGRRRLNPEGERFGQFGILKYFKGGII